MDHAAAPALKFGTKALMKHNKKTAKVGDVVAISPYCQACDAASGWPKVELVTLTRKNRDGTWFGCTEVLDWEYCVGGGYDFRIVSSPAAAAST